MGVSFTLRHVSTWVMAGLSVSLGISTIWMLAKPDTDCLKSLGWPSAILIVVLILNLINLILSSLGLGGKIPLERFPWILLFMSFAFVALLVAIYVLLSVHETHIDDQTTTGRSVRPNLPTSLSHEALDRYTYTLADFKSFLTKEVRKSKIWHQIKDCIKGLGKCQEVNRAITTSSDFYYASLSPIKVGCCMPPVSCGLTPVITPFGITGWVTTSSNAFDYSSSPDCIRWNNDANLYCYDCDSCRASYLATVKGEQWVRVAEGFMIVVAVTLFLTIIFLYKDWQTKKKNSPTE